MNVGKALGVTLSDSQVKSLLGGKKILVKGLKGKKGSYDAYLIPDNIEEFFTRKTARKSRDSSISLRRSIQRGKRNEDRKEFVFVIQL